MRQVRCESAVLRRLSKAAASPVLAHVYHLRSFVRYNLLLLALNQTSHCRVDLDSLRHRVSSAATASNGAPMAHSIHFGSQTTTKMISDRPSGRPVCDLTEDDSPACGSSSGGGGGTAAAATAAAAAAAAAAGGGSGGRPVHDACYDLSEDDSPARGKEEEVEEESEAKSSEEESEEEENDDAAEQEFEKDQSWSDTEEAMAVKAVKRSRGGAQQVGGGGSSSGGGGGTAAAATAAAAAAAGGSSSSTRAPGSMGTPPHGVRPPDHPQPKHPAQRPPSSGAKTTIILDGPNGKQPPKVITPSLKRQREDAEKLEAQKLRGESAAREPAAPPAATPAATSAAAPVVAPGALAEARSANRTLRAANASLKDDLQGARDDLEAKGRELEAQGRELAQAREETRKLRLSVVSAAAAAAAATKLKPKLNSKSSGQAESSCGGSSGAGHGSEKTAAAAEAAAEAEAAAVADEEFTLRLLALRQCIEVMRHAAVLAGKASGFQWKWRLHRTAAARKQDLCEDVLRLMQGAKKKVGVPTHNPHLLSHHHPHHMLPHHHPHHLHHHHHHLHQPHYPQHHRLHRPHRLHRLWRDRTCGGRQSSPSSTRTATWSLGSTTAGSQ